MAKLTQTIDKQTVTIDNGSGDYEQLVKGRLANSSGTEINPATEEKQDDIVTGIGNIETNQTDGIL